MPGGAPPGAPAEMAWVAPAEGSPLYCRTSNCPPAPLPWPAPRPAETLTVSSAPADLAASCLSSRNQPSGNSLIVGPPVRRRCLHRLYLQDGLTAKSAATESDKWRQLVLTIPGRLRPLPTCYHRTHASRPDEPRSAGCSGSMPESSSALATSPARSGGRHSRLLVTSVISAKLA